MCSLYWEHSLDRRDDLPASPTQRRRLRQENVAKVMHRVR